MRGRFQKSCRTNRVAYNGFFSRLGGKSLEVRGARVSATNDGVLQIRTAA
jgi:hypothetical protein